MDSIGPNLDREKGYEGLDEQVRTGCAVDISLQHEETWSLERRARLMSLLHFSSTVYTAASVTFLLTLQPMEDRTPSVKANIATDATRFREKIGPYLEEYLPDRGCFRDRDALDSSGISAADLILAKPLGNADAMG